MDKFLRMEVAKSFVEDSSGSSSSSDSSSDSSSSSDEEWEQHVDHLDQQAIHAIITVGRVRGVSIPLPRIQNYVEEVVPCYSEATFKSHFRMLPTTFRHVLDLIGPALSSTPTVSGRRPVAAEKQLLLALWYMGTPDSYRSVCEKFNVGRATALRSLSRVTYSLHCLAPRVIKWPTGEEYLRVKEGFQGKSGFPDIVGAVDGTHIKIDAPRVDPQSYVTRKDVHALHLQAVCNDMGIFTHCFAGNAASVHDARILRNSAIANYMADGEIYFPEDGHLVGDGAYGIHPHMMVPFRDNGNLTAAQLMFNNRLSRARQTIERAFGLLKARFRSLRDNLPLTDIGKVPEYLLACCVLHNICSMQGDEVADDVNMLNVNNGVVPLDIGNGERRALGRLKRLRLMNQMLP